jgi:VanZ family protein
MKRNIYWFLSLFYAGIIFFLSSYPIPAQMPSFAFSDKVVHIMEYGILASLIYMALKSTHTVTYKFILLAFVLAFLYGISDEVHQYFVPGRHADIFDVMANGIGAFCFPLVLQKFRMKPAITTAGKNT